MDHCYLCGEDIPLGSYCNCPKEPGRRVYTADEIVRAAIREYLS